MLKWLKQKPVSGQDDAHATTDDPLATIQVHQITTPKTSFKRHSNPNEIYSVSRVNPLFEEETGKGPLSPGNLSGSSGYDSGPSDDESPHNSPETSGIPNIADGNVILSVPKSGSKPLFRSQEDVVIRHEATVVGYDDHYGDSMSPPDLKESILHVIEQNPVFVNSIAVATEPPLPGRPLSPVAESKVSLNSAWKSVTAIPLPLRNIDPPAKAVGDRIGKAKLIQKNSNYVQSIRIVPSRKMPSSFGKGCSHHPTVAKYSGHELHRKPSVTFSDLIEVVDGKATGSRRPSSEQDSIVTLSLLMLTSGKQLLEGKLSKLSPPITEAQIHQEMDESEDVMPSNEGKDDDGLTTFSNSLSRNRMVTQVVTRNSASPQPQDGGNGDEEPNRDSGQRPRHVTSTKSSFGGIADHYAAAKEIAKEIESYSQGTTKSTRISLVKDLLLSSRGRGGIGHAPRSDDILRVDGHSPTVVTAVVHLKSSSSTKSELESRGDHLGEAAEVQPQVYVKANDNNVTNAQSHRDYARHHPPEDPNNPHHLTTAQNSEPHHRTPAISHSRQDEGQVQVPIYEPLPPGASHLRNHSHDDSDSGNSTDRCPKEGLYSGGSPLVHKSVSNSSEVPHPEVSNLNPSVNEGRVKREGQVGNDKVMIVSGDSQNMVVDLSGVPLDLREAIISGSALVALPDGLNQRLEAGYTMITVPQDHAYEILPSPKPKPKDSKEPPEGRDNYATKNLAQVWDVLQQKGKGKRITTVLPFHPNQDSHTTADFTIEAQTLAEQTKRVKRLKTRRCCCRVVGICLFLLSFIGVIVAISLVYTRGKHYFGSV